MKEKTDNIDILEELVNGFDNLISYKQKQAIKTLIAENKELKEEIEELKEDNKKKSIVIIEYQDLYEKLIDKIKAKIGKRMQKNNNTIHNAKLKHGKDYVYYDDVQEAKEENRICKEILQSLLEKE